MKLFLAFSFVFICVVFSCAGKEISDEEFARIVSFDVERFRIKLNGGTPTSICGVEWYMSATKTTEEEMAALLLTRADVKYDQGDYQAASDSVSLIGELKSTNHVALLRTFSESITNDMIHSACLYAETRILGYGSLDGRKETYRHLPVAHRRIFLRALLDAPCPASQDRNSIVEKLVELGYLEQDEQCQTYMHELLCQLKPDWNLSSERKLLLAKWVSLRGTEDAPSKWTVLINSDTQVQSPNKAANDPPHEEFGDIPIPIPKP